METLKFNKGNFLRLQLEIQCLEKQIEIYFNTIKALQDWIAYQKRKEKAK